MKVKRNLRRNLARVVRGVRLPEERRRLNPVEDSEIHAVKQVGRVSGDLDSEELLITSWTPVAERFCQAQIQAREVRPAT